MPPAPKRYVCSCRAFSQACHVLDLESIEKFAKSATEGSGGGLSALAQLCLGKPLCKDQQITNWNRSAYFRHCIFAPRHISEHVVLFQAPVATRSDPLRGTRCVLPNRYISSTVNLLRGLDNISQMVLSLYRHLRLVREKRPRSGSTQHVHGSRL